MADVGLARAKGRRAVQRDIFVDLFNALRRCVRDQVRYGQGERCSRVSMDNV